MGQPKQFMRLPDGRAVIQPVLDALRQVCEIVLIAGDPHTLPHVPHVPDESRGQGPLAGIRALLASDIATNYLVCPCDTPLLTIDLLGLLLRPTSCYVTAFRLAGSTDCEPLPIRIAASTLPLVDQELQHGRGALRAVVAHASCHVIDLSIDQAPLLRSLNTPSDFHAMFPSPPDLPAARHSFPPQPRRST